MQTKKLSVRHRSDGTRDLQSYFGVGSGGARAHFSSSGQNVRFDWKFGVMLPWASRGLADTEG